jgi:hypothetical protein
MGLALRLAAFNATVCSVDLKGNGGGGGGTSVTSVDKCPKGTIKNRWAKKPKCVPPNCKHGRNKNGTCKPGGAKPVNPWD